ncbi:MAG: hypothetical protein AABW82_05105 [Nanoarchaeota archaeon]
MVVTIERPASVIQSQTGEKNTDKVPTPAKRNAGSRLYISTNNGSVLAIIYSIDQEEKLRQIKRESVEGRTYEFENVPVEKLEKVFVYKGFKEGPIKFKPRKDNTSSLIFDGLYREDINDKTQGKYSLYRFSTNHKGLVYSLAQKVSDQKDLIKGIDKLIS